MDNSGPLAVLYSFCLLLLVFGIQSGFVCFAVTAEPAVVDKSFGLKGSKGGADGRTSPARGFLQTLVGKDNGGTWPVPAHRVAEHHQKDTQLRVLERREEMINELVRNSGPSVVWFDVRRFETRHGKDG